MRSLLVPRPPPPIGPKPPTRRSAHVTLSLSGSSIPLQPLPKINNIPGYRHRTRHPPHTQSLGTTQTHKQTHQNRHLHPPPPASNHNTASGRGDLPRSEHAPAPARRPRANRRARSRGPWTRRLVWRAPQCLPVDVPGLFCWRSGASRSTAEVCDNAIYRRLQAGWRCSTFAFVLRSPWSAAGVVLHCSRLPLCRCFLPPFVATLLSDRPPVPLLLSANTPASPRLLASKPRKASTHFNSRNYRLACCRLDSTRLSLTHRHSQDRKNFFFSLSHSLVLQKRQIICFICTLFGIKASIDSQTSSTLSF